MKNLLVAAILVSSIVLSGCSSTVYTPGTRSSDADSVVKPTASSVTVYTPGTRRSDAGSVAKLTASSVVGFRNYMGYAVASIKIDGVSYPLNQKPTTFVLTAGTHEVGFTYSTDGGDFKYFGELPRPLPPTTYCFQALPGGRYELVSGCESAGLMHGIYTPEHEDVLKSLPADTP